MAEKKLLRSGLALAIIDDRNRSKHGQGQALLYKNVKLTWKKMEKKTSLNNSKFSHGP